MSLEPIISPRRIVSLTRPWVWPVVRGKAHADTEFGSNLHISLMDNYVRIERLDFEPFNESGGSGGWWPGIGSAMAVIRNAFWQTRSTVAARHWPFAKSTGFIYPAPPWANRQKIRSCPVRQRNGSIRTTATATLWRAFPAQVRPLMAWAASWHVYKKLLSVLLALPFWF